MSNQPRDLPNRTTDFDLAQIDSNYHEESERARRTGKPRIVRADNDGLVRRIERLHPIRFKSSLVPRSMHYWREREEAERFLHGVLCTSTDDRRAEPRWQRESHAPNQCEAHSWKFLDKRYGQLYDGCAAAAGLLPELANHQEWRGTLLLTEFERPNRRGRPAFKQPWFDLASAFRLTAKLVNQSIPRGFFPALVRLLSAPWFGFRFSASELKTATHEIERKLSTVEGVIRNEYSARVRWGDMLMLAVLYSGLPPAQAASRFPEAWSGR